MNTLDSQKGPGGEVAVPRIVESVETAKEMYAEKNEAVYEETQSLLRESIVAGKKVVLIYQMGKVGSSSYAAALKQDKNLCVFHIHRLNNDRMITHFLNNRLLAKAVEERKWQAISDYLNRHSPVVHIISAMRNPINRNISAFFENHEFKKNEIAEELIDKFTANYPHLVPLNWFDEQFRDALGVDIFTHAFDKERGWSNFDHENIRCLLLTAEIPDQEKIKAINSFLGTELVSLERRNVAKEKHYSEVYKVFRRGISLPEDYVSTQLDNKVVRHFYTKEKIRGFRNHLHQVLKPA